MSALAPVHAPQNRAVSSARLAGVIIAAIRLRYLHVALAGALGLLVGVWPVLLGASPAHAYNVHLNAAAATIHNGKLQVTPNEWLNPLASRQCTSGSRLSGFDPNLNRYEYLSWMLCV